MSGETLRLARIFAARARLLRRHHRLLADHPLVRPPPRGEPGHRHRRARPRRPGHRRARPGRQRVRRLRPPRAGGRPQEGDHRLRDRRRCRVLPDGRRRICGRLPEVAQPVAPHSALEARPTVLDLSPGHAADWHLRQLRLRESIRLFARVQTSTRHPCRDEKGIRRLKAGFRRKLLF